MMNEIPEPTDEFEPIAPDKARAAIEQVIIERLGADWRNQWLMVHDSNFLVRLNKGETNMDFQADLLGKVEVTEKEANPIQLGGRFVAWVILGASIFVALAIAIALRII